MSIPSKQFIIEQMNQMLINRYNENTFITTNEYTKNFIVGLVISNTIEQLMTWFTKNPGDIKIIVDSKQLEQHAIEHNCCYIIPFIVTTREIVSRIMNRNKKDEMKTSSVLTAVQLHDLSYIERIEETDRLEELSTLNFDDLNIMLELIPISEDIKLKIIKDAKSLEKEVLKIYL